VGVDMWTRRRWTRRRCLWCQRGALGSIAAIPQGEGITKILRHLQRMADPPPIAPARVRHAAFAWSSA
jgi:hypothetical protein